MTTTTDSLGPVPRVTGMRTLVVTMVVVDLVVLSVTAVAALVEGSEAALAALVGGLVAAVVLFTGTVSVNLVAGLMPAASLLVAVLTYLLQLVVLGVVFVALAGSPLGDDATSRAWLGGALIAATLAWLVGQVVTATRARIPAYDLPVEGPERARPTAEGGGEG